METHIIIYLFEASICLAICYLFFKVFLQKEVFFLCNRVYILASVALSLVIPVLEIPLSRETTSMHGVFVLPLQPIAVLQAQNSLSASFYWQHILMGIYGSICLLVLSRFVYRMIKLFYFSRKLRSSVNSTYRLILTEGKLPTFSFFKLLFWDNSQTFTEENKLQILKHELTHIRQWHSLDIVFIEIVKIIFWFHPAIYLFKRDVQQVHEYLADAWVVKQHNTESYIELLISQIFQSTHISLTNSFNHFPTKNRIMMLQKLKHATPAFWKIALSLPVIGALFFVYACDTNEPEILQETSSQSRLTEVAVDQMPTPVGETEWLESIGQQIQYPAEAQSKNIEGNVIVEFVVQKDGSVSNVMVMKSVGYGCDEEAVKAVKSVKWNPGKHEGKPVDVKMALPVTFALSDAKRTELLKDIQIHMRPLETSPKQIYELQSPQPADEVYQVVEQQPAPIGGYDAFYKYISENLTYPEQARTKGIQGKVFLAFVVGKDGSITDVEILKGIGSGCDEAAVRVIANAPKWNPGKQSGKPVKVRMAVPIAFKL